MTWRTRRVTLGPPTALEAELAEAGKAVTNAEEELGAAQEEWERLIAEVDRERAARRSS